MARAVTGAHPDWPAVFVVADARHAAPVGRLLEALDTEYRVVDRAGPGDVSFCTSRAAVAIIATDDAPLARAIQLFSAGIELPVLVLCARPTPELRADLEHAGVSSCRSWPITAPRLRAALRHLAARRQLGTPADVGLWIDPPLLRIGRGSATVTVTRCELALLQALIANAGEAVPSHRLLRCGWGEQVPARSAGQLVTVHIHNLRRKLERVGLRGAITTVRQFGYMIAPRS